MSDLRELYQDVILDHSRHPRNVGAIEGGRSANGHNPLCGDRVTVFVRLDGDVVSDVKFEGSGCAISQAAASMMTQAVKGRTLDEVRAMFRTYHDMLTGRPEEAESLGKLAVFQGVSEFPIRVKCATLAWHTLKAALDEDASSVTTE